MSRRAPSHRHSTKLIASRRTPRPKLGTTVPSYPSQIESSASSCFGTSSLASILSPQVGSTSAAGSSLNGQALSGRVDSATALCQHRRP